MWRFVLTTLDSALFPDDLDQYPFTAPAVELTVEYLFPRPEIEFTGGDRHDYFAPHDGAFEMGIGIILCTVVGILGIRLLRRQLFQPLLKVGVQARLVIVDEDRRGDVHGVAQEQTLPDAALAQAGFNLWRDVDKFPPPFYVEPQFFAIRFHVCRFVQEACAGNKHGAAQPSDNDRASSGAGHLLGIAFQVAFHDARRPGDSRGAAPGKFGIGHFHRQYAAGNIDDDHVAGLQ